MIQVAELTRRTGPDPARPIRVLVVEDSEGVRERLVGMLSEIEGVDVVGEARSAREAIEQAATLQPDLLTLDLELADGSGFAVLHSVLACTPPPLVAVVSNHASQPIRRRCLNAGANFFFDKSLEFEALAEAVSNLVTLRTRK